MQQMNTMNNDMTYDDKLVNELKHQAKNARAYASIANRNSMLLAPNAKECRMYINFCIKRCRDVSNIFAYSVLFINS